MNDFKITYGFKLWYLSSYFLGICVDKVSRLRVEQWCCFELEITFIVETFINKDLC